MLPLLALIYSCIRKSILSIKYLNSSCLKLCHSSCTALQKQYTLLKTHTHARTHDTYTTQRHSDSYYALAVNSRLERITLRGHAYICECMHLHKIKELKFEIYTLISFLIKYLLSSIITFLSKNLLFFNDYIFIWWDKKK